MPACSADLLACILFHIRIYWTTDIYNFMTGSVVDKNNKTPYKSVSPMFTTIERQIVIISGDSLSDSDRSSRRIRLIKVGATWQTMEGAVTTTRKTLSRRRS